MPTDNDKALTADYSVKVGGSDLPPEARASVARIVVEDSIDRASTFALELNNWKHDAQEVRWSDDNLFKPGTAVEISLGYTDSVTKVIVGEITGLELSFPPDVRSLLVARGYDRLHRFRRGRRTKSYVQAKDSDVAQQIASDLELTPDVEATTEVHPYLLQMNQTDIDFLLSRARAVGYELEVEDKTLRFRKVRNDRGKTVTLSFNKGLRDFHGYLSTADQVSKVTVRGWDPKAKKALVGQAQDSDVNGKMNGADVGPAAAKSLFGDRVLAVVDTPVSTQGEADLLARGLLNEIALDYIVGEATALGTPTIAAGTVVELDGIGKRFNGLYYVMRAKHVFDGTLTTHLVVRRNAS
jgi:Bacteriophage probable baseplate hub protein